MSIQENNAYWVSRARRDKVVVISKNCLKMIFNCNPFVCGGLCCRKHGKDLNIGIKQDGDCEFIKECLLDKNRVPQSCKLFPLKFNTKGRLVVSRYIYGKRGCGYKQGNNPMYKTMKDNLIEVLGQEVYDDIVKQMEE